jgi:hypothetical protein
MNKQLSEGTTCSDKRVAGLKPRLIVTARRELAPVVFLYNYSNMVLRWIKIGFICLIMYLIQQQDFSFSIGFSPKNPELLPQASSFATLSIVDIPKEVSRGEWQPADPDLLTDAQVRTYLKRFEKVALAEMKKFGIPASIKLAMGILESHADGHPLTPVSNNHFGQIFAGQDFPSAWENWRAHSLLIQERYPQLRGLRIDAAQWLRVLQEVNYSSDPLYASKLGAVIGRFQLQRYDKKQ